MQRTDLPDVKPVIFSCEGTQLNSAERDFFKRENPFGFILFARNIGAPDQLRDLIADFRRAVGRPDAPVLVDQEGGRVQRLRNPHWFEAPSFGKIGKIYDSNRDKGRRAAALATQLIAADLQDVGITVNCSPCLDVSLPETSSVIGDRSFHGDPAIVSELAEIVCREYEAAGISPIIKHIPGHGRGSVDSHHELPVVTASLDELDALDLVPFKHLSHMSWGMTAHIVYKTLDDKYPATQSRYMIETIIRGVIGFEGLLLTDDLNMNALAGSLRQRAELAQDAGIDILLHCSGKLGEMKEVAEACRAMTSLTKGRVKAAVLKTPARRITDTNNLKEELAELLALV